MSFQLKGKKVVIGGWFSFISSKAVDIADISQLILERHKNKLDDKNNPIWVLSIKTFDKSLLNIEMSSDRNELKFKGRRLSLSINRPFLDKTGLPYRIHLPNSKERPIDELLEYKRFKKIPDLPKDFPIREYKFKNQKRLIWKLLNSEDLITVKKIVGVLILLYFFFFISNCYQTSGSDFKELFLHPFRLVEFLLYPFGMIIGISLYVNIIGGLLVLYFVPYFILKVTSKKILIISRKVVYLEYELLTRLWSESIITSELFELRLNEVDGINSVTFFGEDFHGKYRSITIGRFNDPITAKVFYNRIRTILFELFNPGDG